MLWDSSPDWDFLTNHETMGPWLFSPTADPTILNVAGADAQELESLLKLQETLLELRKTREIRRLFQIRAGRHASQIVPPDAGSNRNPVFDPSQELLPSFAQQIILPGAENVVTNSSLLPLHSAGDSREATLFGSFVELPSNLSDSTLESSDDLNFVHYSHEPTSDDQGIRPDGNYSLTSTLTFPPVAHNNEGESSTNVFLVNQAETTADRIDAPSSESQTIQAVPVPSSESVTVGHKRRHSVLDLPGVNCFPSNETSNFPREKRPCTDKERENINAVKKLGGACLSCREGKRQVSYLFCYDNGDIY